MEEIPIGFSRVPPHLPVLGSGFLSNGGKASYHLQIKSDTGFIAFEDSSETLFINRAGEIELPESSAFTFWACADAIGATRSGSITALDCYLCHLTQLEVRGLTGLEWLDCHNNELTALDVSGLAVLRHLDCSSNRLGSLNLGGCTGLEELFCSRNGLTDLALHGRLALEYLDCSENHLAELGLRGLHRLCRFGRHA